MARIPFIGNVGGGGRNQPQADPPYSGSAPTQPLEQLVGHTTPEPDPASVRPRVGQVPIGQSGRANFYGLPQTDELNPTLVGPAGLRVLDDMYRTDAHVRRLILAAWAPIVAGSWALEPYGGEEAKDADRKIAEQIWWMLTEWMSPNFTEHLMSVGPLLLRSGFTPYEQLWGTVKHDSQTLLGPRKLDVRLPRTVWRWWQDDFGELTHIGQILPNKPDVVIPATELMYYRLGAEGDNWQGTSLLRHAYKHWFLKDRLERIDAIGQERKAVGVPIVYHSTDIDAQTLTSVEQAVANMHVSEVAYLMLPGRKMGTSGTQGIAGTKEWLVDVVQFDSSSGSSIQASIEYHQKSIAASFLTDFLELGHHQVGARATAEVQEDPFMTAVNGALLPPVIPPWNRLIDRICKLNFDGAEGSPTLKLTLHDDASLSEISAYVQQLAAAGAMQVDPDLEDWLRERAGLPPANQQVRAQKQKLDAAQQDAELAGAQATAADPQGVNAAQQMAAAKAPPTGGKPGAPAKAGQGKPAAASKSQSKPPAKSSSKQLDAAAPESEPTVKWFERLLSQDRLREAFDGARDHIQTSVGPHALTAARKMAHQASNGVDLATISPPVELADALTRHYTDMYALGHETVTTELARQRHALGKHLDTPTNITAGAAATRLARARQRGGHSAQNIISKVREILGRAQITGLQDPAALQTAAEQAATAQLRVEALANTAATVNDGRYDSATAAGDVVGAYYSSVMDERSCDECIRADDGVLLSPEDAIAFGPPNPLCAGRDFCRCALIWVLSGDPAALSAVEG